MKIQLASQLNDVNERCDLAAWLYGDPQLTMGPLTKEFEATFASYIGTKYAVMTNSGSSANLIAACASKLVSKSHYDFVIVPAISWATTITPYMNLDYNTIILCDVNMDNLGLDIDHLKQLCVDHAPSVVQTANILGFPNDYDEIKNICEEHKAILIEDGCETLGSKYKGTTCGNFGMVSTFSSFFGHIISTIEGGMACTNSEELYIMLLMLRAHGWDRNLPKEVQEKLRSDYGIDDFNAAFTFYVPGYNVRPMEIQAFLGLKQMEKLDQYIEARRRNYMMYDELITNVTWKPKLDIDCVNFAYPIMVEDRQKTVKALTDNSIECRPIVCGSMNRQPFFVNYQYKRETLTPNADKIHEHGLYVPNHPGLTEDDVKLVCKTINEVSECL